MARAATTSDVFNAIAEPRRRRLIDVLAGEPAPLPVGRLVRRLRLAQPAVSKHLGVLRKVGLVSMSRAGRQRLYRLNPEGLKPVHDWIHQYERFWSTQIDRIKARAERLARERSSQP